MWNLGHTFKVWTETPSPSKESVYINDRNKLRSQGEKKDWMFNLEMLSTATLPIVCTRSTQFFRVRCSVWATVVLCANIGSETVHKNISKKMEKSK